MFCSNCGNNLPEGSKFCPHCGKTTASSDFDTKARPDPDSSTVNAAFSNDAEPTNSQYIKCPKCGCNHCQPHYKQDVSSTGKNYSCLQGGLGMLITGPFGLLCGLCGQGVKTTSTNTLVWVCPNCGKEFRSHEDIYESIFRGYKANIGILTIGGIIADIFSLDNLWNGFMIWIILGIFSAMTYYPMKNLPRENFGVDIRDFFSEKEKAEIKKSLKPWILALAIVAAIFALLIFLNLLTI